MRLSPEAPLRKGAEARTLLTPNLWISDTCADLHLRPF